MKLLSKEHFIADARKVLAGISPVEGMRDFYLLEATQREAHPFIATLIHELMTLPYHDESGKTCLLRSDAPQVIGRLCAYLMNQQERVKSGMVWDPSTTSIADIFSEIWRLEVFKNEIYPSMMRAGICYSLDLGAYGNGTPFSMRLERFYVDATTGVPAKCTIKTQGSTMVQFEDGILEVRLDETTSRLSHLGP